MQSSATYYAGCRAGGAITKPAESESWGGYGGYFTDPDGQEKSQSLVS